MTDEKLIKQAQEFCKKEQYRGWGEVKNWDDACEFAAAFASSIQEAAHREIGVLNEQLSEVIFDADDPGPSHFMDGAQIEGVIMRGSPELREIVLHVLRDWDVASDNAAKLAQQLAEARAQGMREAAAIARKATITAAYSNCKTWNAACKSVAAAIERAAEAQKEIAPSIDSADVREKSGAALQGSPAGGATGATPRTSGVASDERIVVIVPKGDIEKIRESLKTSGEARVKIKGERAAASPVSLAGIEKPVSRD